MLTSKLTAKAQTTIPQPVRRALQLREGDDLLYQIDGERVVLMKAAGKTSDDPFRCFDEWHSPADKKAYAKL